ncbi:MAG TPA: hypothetical protein VGJ28_09380 [Micromonosporaceae bacterium]
MTRPTTGVSDSIGRSDVTDPDVPGTSGGAEARRDDSPKTALDAVWRWRQIDAIVALFFVCFAYYITSQIWHSPSTLASNANTNDPTFFEWMLEHAVRVFTHGENPLFTSQLNAPSGVNLMSNTSLLGLAIPFAPLTAWLGPSVVFVLITMLGLAGTAFAWYYVLARHFVHNRLGAFIGAAFCGFGPGIITHANGHPNITAQFVIPFILARALGLRNSRRPARDGVILGLLVTYQAFLNEELLFMTALAGTIFVLAYFAFRPSSRKWIPDFLTGIASAAVTALVLLAYPLYFQFRGPQHFSGLPSLLSAYPYWLPLNSFVTLPSLSHWGVPWGTPPNGFPTGTEQNSFFGWALLIVVVLIIAVLWKRRPEVRALAIVGVLFCWLSLGGGRIALTGDPHTKTYPLSLWRFVSGFPLFDSVLPSRLAMVAVPVIGVLLALAVADSYRALANALEQRRILPGGLVPAIALAAIVGALVTVAPTPVPVTNRSTVPRFFTSGDWKPYVPKGYSVLSATPFAEQDFMRWSIAAKLDFPVAGGYFLGPGSDTDPNPVGQYGPQWRSTMLVLGAIGAGSWALPTDDSGYQAKVIPDLDYWHTSIIVLTFDQPHGDQEKAAITRLTGVVGQQVDDVWLWDVRSLVNRPPA